MGAVVLGLLLMGGPQTIYLLHKHFDGGVGQFYAGSLGSLRAALIGLQNRGEVVFEEGVERGRNKKTYSVTPRGVEAFFAWIKSPITTSDAETQFLARCFFLGLVEDPAVRREILTGIVAQLEEQTARFVALAEMLDGMDIHPGYRRFFPYQRATLEYGIGSNRYAMDFFTALSDAETSDKNSAPTPHPTA